MMSSKFTNRRKPRKIVGDGEDGEEEDVDVKEPVVKRPPSSKIKAKPKSKLNLSFGPGETSMNDTGDEESEVVIPKRRGLGHKAMENSASNRLPGLSGAMAERLGQDSNRPTYSSDYLKELRDSTPSTPKTSTDDETNKAVDVAAKFGEVMKVSGQSHIPSESEIREKKARRARLAMEHGAEDDGYIALDDKAAAHVDDWDAVARGDKEVKDTRLIRDDEDFAEGFEQYVEDGKVSLGRTAEREKKRNDREVMRELIDDAEGLSDEEDSDLEEKASYEAAQTKAAMGRGNSDRFDGAETPLKITPLPRLANCFERMRMSLASMEAAKTQMISRMEELRKEKAEIALREVEVQAKIKEAGENYERLKREAAKPQTDSTSSGALEKSTTLESIHAPVSGSNLSVSSDSSFEDDDEP